MNKTKHTWSGQPLRAITHLSITRIIVFLYLHMRMKTMESPEGNLVKICSCQTMKRAYICPQIRACGIVSDAHWGKIHVWDVESGDLLNTIEWEDLFLSNISDNEPFGITIFKMGSLKSGIHQPIILEHQLNIQHFNAIAYLLVPMERK